MTQASSSTAGSVATAVGDTWAHNSSGPPFFYFKNINIYVVFKPDQKHHLELTDTGEIDLQGIRLIIFFFLWISDVCFFLPIKQIWPKHIRLNLFLRKILVL